MPRRKIERTPEEEAEYQRIRRERNAENQRNWRKRNIEKQRTFQIQNESNNDLIIDLNACHQSLEIKEEININKTFQKKSYYFIKF